MFGWIRNRSDPGERRAPSWEVILYYGRYAPHGRTRPGWGRRSGDLVSADDYAKYSLNATKRIVQKLKEGGKVEINHICGDTFDRIERVYETGSVGYSVDYQVDIGEAVKAMNGRMAMIGNINPAATIFSGNPDAVRAETKKILEKGGRKGFLFGSGCDIPVGSAYENVHAMSEVFMKF